jgi:ribulose 1,5-bisphosphate synthetase/thiazole synthase
MLHLLGERVAEREQRGHGSLGGLSCVVVGAGPVGLRCAVELAL